MELTNSIYIAGVTGTGKTYGACKLVRDLGLRAVVIDFENKFKKNVKVNFGDCSDIFEWYIGYVKRESSRTSFSLTKNNKMMSCSTEALGLKNTPDWEKSYMYLVELVEGLINRVDYDVLIFDGASPVLRNDLGLAQWKLNNPDRDNPNPEEWGPMNDIESMFIRGGIAWAEENNKLFVLIGQMKDEYKGGKKVKDVPALNMKQQHPIDVSLQLEKYIGFDKTTYKCTCLDSPRGQWVENLTFDRHIIDVLVEKELIGYD